LSGEDLGKITDLALKTGKDVKTAVEELGLTHKASATAPEVQ